MLYVSHGNTGADDVEGIQVQNLTGRLTGGGHWQSKELYKDIKYAPTVMTPSVMAISSISAEENRAVAGLDFTGAFLYADMPVDVDKATLVRLGQF